MSEFAKVRVVRQANRPDWPLALVVEVSSDGGETWVMLPTVEEPMVLETSHDALTVARVGVAVDPVLGGDVDLGRTAGASEQRA